jgi:hypothetical protein
MRVGVLNCTKGVPLQQQTFPRHFERAERDVVGKRHSILSEQTTKVQRLHNFSLHN